MVKNLPANKTNAGLIPVSQRSPRGGNGNPLQYSYLGNPERLTGLQSRGSQRVGHDLAKQQQQKVNNAEVVNACLNMNTCPRSAI